MAALDPVRTLATSIMYFGGYFHARARLLARRFSGRRLLILVYHNLSDGRDANALERRLFELRPVTPIAHFECLLRVLSRSYRVVSLAQGALELQQSPERDELSVAITFDDGYQSFLTRALPLLNQYGCSATMFLATDYIDEPKPFWWDELTQLVAEVRLEPALFGELEDCTGIEFPDGANGHRHAALPRRRLLALLEARLAGLPTAKRVEQYRRLKEILAGFGAASAQPAALLNWNQIRDLAARGIDFGVHTRSHLNLAGASEQTRDREIGESVLRLKAELDRPVELFAYPYGMQPEAYRASFPLLKKHGIRYARTMWPGVNSAATDPLLLCSAPVEEATVPHRVRLGLLRAVLS